LGRIVSSEVALPLTSVLPIGPRPTIDDQLTISGPKNGSQELRNPRRPAMAP